MSSAQRTGNVLQKGFKNFSATWAIELQDKAASSIKPYGDSLLIDSKAGATVWLKKKLSGNIVIEYDRKVLMNDSVLNKRLSDVNQFWMATDLGNKDPFHFSGRFADYDQLSLYYFGFGGNSNKTTRFRKYQNGNRTLLKEYKDKAHLLISDKTYHIKTAVVGNHVLVWIDGQLYFNYTDNKVLGEGYFGFRLTWSAQLISNFVVYRPDEKLVQSIKKITR